MKKKVVALVLLTLLVLTSTALATNWIFVKRVNDAGVVVYIDSETVYKGSDTITFWSLGVWDQVRNDGVKKGMIHYEATLSRPWYYRQIEGYLYDERNNELNHDTDVREWKLVPMNNSAIQKLVESALSYAR